MRDDDDDVLAGYDLSAWEVPPPSAGLADAVISRAKQPAPVGAIDPGERTPRRWWIVGGVAAVVAAGLGVALWGIQRAPRDGEADVVATQAQRLDLGASSAQLDPGTQLHWRRAKHKVTVSQPRGAAAWTVAADDTLMIDAGATVASVEATGASLRVEVTMNLSDARVIGTSALTAAAVAMVTVVVYEGHVNVTSGGQTVTVQPGATLELHGPKPTPDPPQPVAVAADLRKELEDRDAEIQKLRHELEAMQAPRPTSPACDEVSCVLNNYDGACCTKFKQVGGGSSSPPAPPKQATTCDFDALKAKGESYLSTGMDAAALNAYEAAIRCKPDSTTMRMAAVAACRSKNAPRAALWLGKLPAAETVGIVQICVRNGIVIPPLCDADALRTKGEEALQIGQDALGLQSFEASLSCKADPGVERFAFMAACRSKDAESARRHFARLPASTTSAIMQICLRNGIDSQMLTASTGTLKVQSKPPARIFIDGTDTGQTTPMVLSLAPGKHKVTYLVGDDKFTFPTTIEIGKVTAITKDLQ